MPSGNSTNVTVWIVTSAPFEGTTRAALQEINVKDQNIDTLQKAVFDTYSKIGGLPFSPVNFGVKSGDSILMSGQIEGDQINILA